MELDGRLSSVKGKRKAFKRGQSVLDVNTFNKLDETNPRTAVK
jgi:hypothetical protein